MEPIKFKPIFKERIWGANNLNTYFGKDVDATDTIGESWELADLANGVSHVDGGAFDGLSLRDLLKKHGQDIGFTQAQCAFSFGLLIKFLDAQDDLSVQVHPDLEAVKVLPEARLKTECWYIIDAKADALIYCGLKPGTTKDDLRNAITNGTVQDLLLTHHAKKGDFWFLPAGCVHAIGAGILIAEIQTPSDTTYRIFDWNRTDASGHSRELHIEQSLICAHLEDRTTEFILADNDDTKQFLTVCQSFGTTKSLVNCPYFYVAHVTITSGRSQTIPIEKPVVMIALTGNGKFICEGKTVSYKKGDTILIPKTNTLALNPESTGEFLITCLGLESA
jgi:mannose-6-phosphate isomerase